MTASPYTDKYFLSRKAHLCTTMSNAVVILDLSSGKYFSLDKTAAGSLGSAIADWPVSHDETCQSSLLQTLIDRGLVTRDVNLGKPARPISVMPPTGWLAEARPRGWPAIRMSHVWNFAVAAGYAALSKRFRPLEKTVARIERRKARSTARDVDLQTLTELVRVFDWLRPLAFKKRDNCFLHCLTLSEFLAKYGIYPEWIFGVHEKPFSAHCWLQYQRQLLTDIPFNVRYMTPILAL